jgi:hypothetical protein
MPDLPPPFSLAVSPPMKYDDDEGEGDFMMVMVMVMMEGKWW